MSTFTTTVEGSTLAEIEEAADDEVARFFADYEMDGVWKSRRVVFDIRPHVVQRSGDGTALHTVYQAEVTVTW
jgi:hypothetical protein